MCVLHLTSKVKSVIIKKTFMDLYFIIKRSFQMKRTLSLIIVLAFIFQSLSAHAAIIGEGYDIVTGKIENGAEELYPTGDRHYEPISIELGSTVDFHLDAADTSVAEIAWSVADENVIQITEQSTLPNVYIKAVNVGQTTLTAYKMSYSVATGQYSLAGACFIPIQVIDSSTYDIVSHPTKTEKGMAVKTLPSGKQSFIEIPPLSDTSVWSDIQTVNPTCTENGYTLYTSKYGDVKEIIANTDHKWEKLSETDLPNGETNLCYQCSVCQTVKNEIKYNFLYYMLSDSTICIYGFKNGTNLSGKVTFPAIIDGYDVKQVGIASNGTYNFDDVTELIFESGIEEINTSFADSENLERVSLPDTLKYINSYTFKNCTKLQHIEIPSSVISIEEEAFSDCTSLSSVLINDGVEEICSYAFLNCPIEVLSLPDSIKHLADSSFSGSKITEITLHEGLETFSLGAFSNVEYYYIPSSVTTLNNLYSLNSSCKGILVSNDNSNYSSDEYGVLYNKAKTELLSYPAGLTEKIYNIPDDVEIVGPVAFGNYEQKHLETIRFPESLTKISNSAFFNCMNLCKVIYDGTEKSYTEIIIGHGNRVLGSVEVICEKTDTTAEKTLPDLYVEYSDISSAWAFAISNNTYSENAIIYIGIYDEDDKLLTTAAINMIEDDFTHVSIKKVDNYSYAKIFEWVPLEPVTNAKNISLK